MQYTLNLNAIILVQAYVTTESTFIIWFQSFDDHIHSLRVEKMLVLSYNNIFPNEDLTQLQLEELKKARA